MTSDITSTDSRMRDAESYANRRRSASTTSHEHRASSLDGTRHRGIYERAFKPGLDYAVGLILTVLTAPLMMVLALFVLARLGRPVLYREERVGKNGKIFKMNRFRTMRMATAPDQDFESRLVPAGRLLRRWSLDELPQIWNILTGDMSLVGPRPERPVIVDAYDPWQHRRHQVKPGATGLWQVTARGDGRHMHRHVDVDLTYIDRLSLLYDLRILAKSLTTVARRPERPSAIPGVVDTLALPKRTWREVGYLATKRLFDLTLSVALLLLLSPLLLMVAIAIKLDSPGPVLFHQVRVGHKGRLFRVVKFRTMMTDASEEIHRAHYQSLSTGRPTDSIKLEGDPRVTRIGRLLRGWSIDELPNLWNVAKGEMSLVGPRPIVPYELDLYSPDEMRRLDAKPGITGMAQVGGRGEITMRQRVAYDLTYVTNRSLVFDLKILLRTLLAVLRTRGA